MRTKDDFRFAVPQIHPTAIVDPAAQLADDVTIGPFYSVGPNVTLGAGTQLDHGAYVGGRTTLGRNNRLFPYAVLGCQPQDKKYDGEPTELRLGDDNVIREHVTIHIGTEGGGGVTRLGSRNLLMAGTHVGHDCQIGDDCILANTTGLAGHVVLEDWVILGGQTGIHQFVRVGAHSMTSGGSKVGKDIPPFTMAQGYPARLRGLNLVGLKRRGFADDQIKQLRQAYRAMFFGVEGTFDEVLERVRGEFAEVPAVQQFLTFLAEAQSSDRGFLRPLRNEDNGTSG